MKKFEFPLERVMEFRRTQARIEEAKLEALNAESAAIESRQAELEREAAESELDVVSAAVITALELAAQSEYRRFVEQERMRIHQARNQCRQRIDVQMQVVTAKRRDVKLLERLRAQRLKVWKSEFDRVIDEEAHEAHLAKIARER